MMPLLAQRLVKVRLPLSLHCSVCVRLEAVFEHLLAQRGQHQVEDAIDQRGPDLICGALVVRTETHWLMPVTRYSLSPGP